MKSVTVRVTREDIRKGDRCTESCPIALAFKRASGAKLVSVGRYSVVFGEAELRRRVYFNATHITEFVDAFDSYRPVKPFTFKLRIPEGK